MVLHFNVKGENRKEMVKAIEKELGVKSKYLGVPSCAYQVGEYRVERNGTLSFEKDDIEETSRVVDACVMATGYSPKEWEENMEENTGEEPAENHIELTVTMPIEKVEVKNLINLLEAKGDLIKKALEIDEVEVEVDEDKGTVSFPWFKAISPEEGRTYTTFISALCKMSVNQKRITAKAKDNENEKYAFRCFLLRLGFIGDEYKADRKILLKNLTGSAAFKSGAKKGGEA
jgi:hypothetical protein